MYINKEDDVRKLSLREQLNRDIKNIAREKLAERNLDKVSRQILEEISTDEKHQLTKAA